VAIVSLVIPLLIGVDWLVARMRGAPQDRTAVLVYAISGIIACLGCYWFLERTVFGA
jgi:ribose/xylose/arabinose/galactoside ABC-type transport system permease subunit